MFIGHYAPAFVAAARPNAPGLGTLFIAAQAVDYAFFGFSLIGVERFRLVPGYTAMNPLDLYWMPFSHSLVGTLAFAAAFAVAMRFRRAAWPAAMLAAAVVASHWLLDWLVHVPDLTMMGVGARHGLGLWQQPLVAMPLELALVALALVYYVSHRPARSRSGEVPIAVLTAALLGMQAIDWFGARPDHVVDPAPASVALTALAAFTGAALLAAWAGANRGRRIEGASA